jgi:acyl carrier protein
MQKISLIKSSKENKIINIIGKCLGLKKKDIILLKKNKKNYAQISYGIHPKWDSMNNVKILATIEKELKIKINSKNISNFYNLSNIIRFIANNK